MKDCEESILTIGSSGYISVPTTQYRNGWSNTDKILPSCPDDNHPHQIDMGDGIKWACCNVGASSPLQNGDYYAWGETKSKSVYDWSTYTLCKGSGYAITKYCTNSNYGTVDNKTQLELNDDAAFSNWGGTWRMPTDDELYKLNRRCTWTWTTISNVSGYIVKASNGNMLFFSAAGQRDGSRLFQNEGCYWSSSLSTIASYEARYLLLWHNLHDLYNNPRYLGRSVRPVTE